MGILGPNKSDLETANWVLRDRLQKPNQTKGDWPSSLPRTQAEFDSLISDAKKVVEENKGKYLPTEIAEFESLLSEYYNKTPGAQLGTLRDEANSNNTNKSNSEGKTKELPPVNSIKIQKLKTALENESSSSLTPDGLTKILEKLKDEKDTDNRAIIASYIWSKMNHGGYTTTIMNGNISVEHATDKMGATSLEKTLQAHIGANILTVADIQRAMIVGPDSFRKYLNTQKVDIRKATTDGYAVFIMESRGIDLTRANTPEQKTRIIRKSKSTPDEKAFLLSYVNGGLRNYNITPEIERQIKLSTISAEIKASPAMQKAEAAVQVASNGGVQAEQKRMEEAGEEKLDWNTFINNPMKAVSKYPWTSLGVILGSMYKFGIMKTLLGLVGGILGYKIVDELGGIDALMKNDEKPAEPEAPKEGARKKATLPEMDHNLDLSKKGPEEKQLWENLQATPSIKKTLNSRKETLGSYMVFIDKNNLLTKTLGDLVYTDPHDASIFSNKTSLPAGIQNLPKGIDPVMLKRILRVLISGVDRYPITDPEGLSHTNNYKSWVLGKSMSSIDGPTWKAKKIADIVPDIARKL